MFLIGIGLGLIWASIVTFVSFKKIEGGTR